jgi:hypothetical protein
MLPFKEAHNYNILASSERKDFEFSCLSSENLSVEILNNLNVEKTML